MRHRARTIRQEKIPTLERLVRVLYRIDDRPALAKACGELLAVDPGNAVGAMGMAKAKSEGLPAAAPTTTPQTITPTRAAGRDQEEAEAALFLGQPEMALPPLRRALAVRPDALRLKISLAVSLLTPSTARRRRQPLGMSRPMPGRAPTRSSDWRGRRCCASARARPRSYNDVLRLDPDETFPPSSDSPSTSVGGRRRARLPFFLTNSRAARR